MSANGHLRVGVIGAGGSGLLAAAALRRAGVEFEVLESRNGVGGTWRYDPEGDSSACYASLLTNTSKLRTSLRGRSIPGCPWQYASHTEMLSYLERLADHEGVLERVRLGVRVASARREDSSWTLTAADGTERNYDAVVCALGANGRPRFAPVPGQFAGEQLHSASYRTPERFAGQDVLVIGLGTSGCEIAGDLAGTARSVRVAVRSPLWMMTRRLAGIPCDWLDDPRIDRIVPWSVRRRIIGSLCTLTTGSLHRGGVPRPTRRCGDDIIAISDTFPSAVRSGHIQFSPAPLGALGNRVSFTGGTTAEADVIIHATGFDPPTDFLPEDARPHHGLYHGAVHAQVPNLYFVGLIEAHRALLPIVAEQATWLAAALAGRIPIPPPDIRSRRSADETRRRRRDFGERHPFLVDHARYRAMLRREVRAARRVTT